jgi:hypothetical protein
LGILQRSRGYAQFIASLLLLLSGCTSDGSTQQPAPLISSLPGNCDSLGRAPVSAEITFLVDDRLYAAPPDGSSARCLAELEQGSGLTWGGEADRVALDTATGGLILTNDQRELLQPDESQPVFEGLSRPVGTSLVYISADGKRLLKLPVDGGRPDDISFLKRHDEVAYHPSGTSVIVVGEERAGNYGIFFATNEGKDPRLLAIGEDAKRIYSLAFSHDGRTLYYAAEHPDRYDLHALALTSGERAGSPEAVTEGRLKTLHSSQAPIDNVVVSEFEKDPPVAYTEGSCETGIQTFVWKGEGVARVGDDTNKTFTTPVGWLPDGGLLAMSRSGGCDRPGTLKVWEGGYSDSLVDQVTQAAVRAPFPPPPRPLIPAKGVVP